MARFTQTGATGSGEALIDGGTSQAPVQVAINVTAISSPRVRQLGMPPVALRYAGTVMLGHPDAVAPVVEWFTELRWMRENHDIANTFYIEALFWRLMPGVTADITVEW